MNSTCTDLAILGFVKILKTIFLMIEVLAPAFLVLSLGYLIFRLVTHKDEKDLDKTKGRIKNAVIATAIVFFIPVFINLLMYAIGEKFEVSACWKKAETAKVFGSSRYIEKKGYRKKSGSFIINPKDYKYDYNENPNSKYSTFGSAGTGSSYSSGPYKGKLFSPETLKIVNAHKDDFNYYNFHSFMKAHGGVDNYISGLGGVFTKYYGKNVKVKNKEEFHEVSEYVYGLMTMWGFDYKGSSKYCKWGGKCGGSRSSSDAFYPGALKIHKMSDSQHFDKTISGKTKNGLVMNTCCNKSVDMVFTKAGFKMHSYNYKETCKNRRYGSLSEAQVGDLIHFFKSPINKTGSPSSWHGWYHVAYIGEVYPDKVVGYDGGSYFTKNRNYKWEAKKGSAEAHHTKNWVLCRPVIIP